ncbi:AAA family ATPase [Acinetobacter sp. TSRC1-2]|uniref:AAA family ATPase n=1 Tax=unclassified Acinetobacter TaxID=196816 RepID=UPI003CE6EE5B
MKILRLSLNNLASLTGTQHIDFESGPLAHAGLIAITGKTGAGKSTLLDAMCLALYNEIPRLKGATGSLKDAGGQDVSIKDSKNILRRGCVHGFAELEFIALDQKRYTARWEVRRAHKRVDGNLKIERAITCLDDQRVLNQKISECTPIVEKLIGLSFEQFTRAVLLAQSEVGAFLKAKDNERADLLEYLTNSQIFSVVSQKAFEKHQQVRQKRNQLENLIGHLELLSDEELTILKQQQHEYKLQLENLDQSEKLLDNDLKWYKQKHSLYTEIQAKKEVYDVQLDADQKMAAHKQLLSHLDEFQAIREQFVQQTQIINRQNNLVVEQQKFDLEFSQIKQQSDAQQDQFKHLQQQQQAHLKHIQAIKPHLDRGLKLDHEIQLITEQYKKVVADQSLYTQQHIQPLQQLIDVSKQNIEVAQQQKNQLNSQLEQHRYLAVFDHEPQSILQRLQDYQKLHQQLTQQQPEILQQSRSSQEQAQQQLTESLQQFNQKFGDFNQLEQQVQQLQTQEHQTSTRILQLKGLIQNSEQMRGQEAEQQQLVQDIQAAQLELQQFNKTATELSQNVAKEEKALQQLQSILTQQRLLQTQSVQELRAQLQPNEACMVCGSHEHPFVQHQELLDTALHQLHDQQLQQAQQQLNQLKNELQQSQIQQSKIKTLLEQKQQRCTQLDRSCAQQKADMTQTIQRLQLLVNVEANSTELMAVLQTQLTRMQQQEIALGEQFKTLQQAWHAWRQQQQQFDHLKLSLQQRTQLEEIIKPVIQVLPEALQKTWQTNSTAICPELQQHLKQRLICLNQLKDVEQQLQQLSQQFDKDQHQLKLHQQRHTEMQQEIERLIQQGKDLRAALTQLTEQYADKAYKVAAEWRDQLEHSQQALTEQLQIQHQVTERHDQRLQQAVLQQQSWVTQIQQLTQQLEQCSNLIQQWQMIHPHFTDDLIEKCLAIDLPQHQQIRQHLQVQSQTLENAKIAWQTLEDQYQKHLKQQPQLSFEEVGHRLTTLTEDKSTQLRQFNQVDTQLRVHAEKQNTLSKYQSQIEQIKAEEYRWGRIYDLIGHKEGTKFQKIAQEHHLDILVEYANQQLQPLAPRYQLHRIPDSLSLAIVDLDMNSEVRPVLSLSGGETFLVSLALALAIANMASGSMKLESLFIDEGFGTLDPASLHMVMNALDHLQSQGRKVVLISHIQEMHERIPVQIQVKPLGAGASTIQIVG